MSGPILSAVVGDNADLFEAAARLYVEPGELVVDLTYGKGIFWRNLEDLEVYLLTNDLDPDMDTADHFDCRDVPFEDGTFDVAVLDPPYKFGTSAQMNPDFDGYGNNERPERGARAVHRFYEDAIHEATRILGSGGRLMVKCMDQVESGRNHWTHVLVFHYMRWAGLDVDDLFVLVRSSTPPMRHSHQVHSRKNLSYLWVGWKRA